MKMTFCPSRMMLFIATAGILLTAGNSPRSYGQTADPLSICDRSVICPGETLRYEVSWLNIKLGQVRLITLPVTTDSGQPVYHTVAYIDSYSGLPFVDLHAIDHTNFDTLFYSRGFRSSDKKDDGWKTEQSAYDFPHHRVFIENIIQIIDAVVLSPVINRFLAPQCRVKNTKRNNGASLERQLECADI